MILWDYYQAKKSLKESEKTIKMMGEDCPVSVLAQHDMNVFIVKHLKEESKYFLWYVFIFCIFISFMFVWE